MTKIYIVRTKMEDGQMYYLNAINISAGVANFTKNIEEAKHFTKEEMNSVKEKHLPGLGRWVVFESEKKRVKKAQEGL